jgi:hypothetical protein
MTRGDIKLGAWWTALGCLAAACVLVASLLWGEVRAQAADITALKMERVGVAQKLDDLIASDTKEHNNIMRKLEEVDDTLHQHLTAPPRPATAGLQRAAPAVAPTGG